MAETPNHVGDHLIGGPKPTNQMAYSRLHNSFLELRRYAQHQIVGSYEFQECMYLLIFVESLLKKKASES